MKSIRLSPERGRKGSPVSKKALVTLAIGQAYSDRFERFCRSNWSAYAARHGYDLIIFKEPLDSSERAIRRSPAWQKCLVPSAPGMADYERVVWVDSDIAINPAAPSIVDTVPVERIGATDEHRFPSPEARQAILDAVIAASPDSGAMSKNVWQAWRDSSAWHTAFGLPGGQAHIVQTGVLAMSPKHHREVLEHVYHAYEDGGSQALNYEMRPLSHEIQARGLQHWIDPRFNALLWWLFLNANAGESEAELRRFVRDVYARSYFLHFAGCAHLMPLLAS